MARHIRIGDLQGGNRSGQAYFLSLPKPDLRVGLTAKVRVMACHDVKQLVGQQKEQRVFVFGKTARWQYDGVCACMSRTNFFLAGCLDEQYGWRQRQAVVGKRTGESLHQGCQFGDVGMGPFQGIGRHVRKVFSRRNRSA